MKNTAFTLIEILIVVILLGILAAVVIPQFTDASADARESAEATDIASLQAQVELYLAKEGAYPTTLQTLEDAGYIRELPTDASLGDGTTPYSYDAATGVVSSGG